MYYYIRLIKKTQTLHSPQEVVDKRHKFRFLSISLLFQIWKAKENQDFHKIIVWLLPPSHTFFSTWNLPQSPKGNFLRVSEVCTEISKKLGGRDKILIVVIHATRHVGPRMRRDGVNWWRIKPSTSFLLLSSLIPFFFPSTLPFFSSLFPSRLFPFVSLILQYSLIDR